MHPFNFEEIRKDPSTLNNFGSRTFISVCCTRCSNQVFKTKKDILDYVTKGREGLFCGNKCSREFYNKNKVFLIPCKFCSTELRRTKSQIIGNVFCSSSCAAKFSNKGKQKNKPIPRTCKSCDSSYYCSQEHESITFCPECSQERQMVIQPKRDKVQYICTDCHTPYYLVIHHKSKVYCAPCKESLESKKSNKIQASTSQIKSMTLSHYTSRTVIKDKHPSWKFSHIRVFNRSWNKDLTKMKCQVCTYDKHVELAHIRAVSDFPEDALLGEVNHPDNILVLCRNHHWEFDHGLLKLEDIPQREKSIQAVVA